VQVYLYEICLHTWVDTYLVKYNNWIAVGGFDMLRRSQYICRKVQSVIFVESSLGCWFDKYIT